VRPTELQKKLWVSDTFVDFEQGLNNAMKRLRAALDDSAESPHFIETLPRHGYRFVGSVNGPERAPTGRNKTRSAGALIRLLALLLLVGGVWLFYSARRSAPVTSPSEYKQITYFTDSAVAPSLSPDGRMVTFKRGEDAFFSTGQIYVKLLPNGESVQLTNDNDYKFAPVFTPDGSRVAYTDFNVSRASSGPDTSTVPVLGGQPTLLLPNASGLTWISDRRILFSERKPGFHMGIVSSTESRADRREVYFPANEHGMAHYSYASPDHQSVLVVEMDQTSRVSSTVPAGTV
jgi:hypothetical protein